MKFTKMHGCGNDYVYINCMQEQIENAAELAIQVSDRHFGIGSDGLILICPSDKADFRMRMYNADGSEAQMCGNGIRCVGKYVYDHGLTKETSITVETLAGIKYLTLLVEAGKVAKVTVDMGSPITEAAQIPVVAENSPVVAEPFLVQGKEYLLTCVSMGNPHAVLFVEDTDAIEIEKIGPCFENQERFPERTNTEFIQIVDRTRMRMRVWERGSGETLACGTWACASVYAAILNGKTEDEVTVELLGGELQIRYDREQHKIFMTGPAVTVFEGEM